MQHSKWQEVAGTQLRVGSIIPAVPSSKAIKPVLANGAQLA